MLEGTETAAETEQATPAIGTEGQDETELQTEVTEQPGEGEEGAEPADELEEIEHEGAKYRIPKAVKPLVMMQADYTRKTQEVADQRRAIESEREAVTKSIEAQRAHARDLGKVHVLDETLAQYQQVDWQTLRAQDPERANAMFQDYVQLRDQRETLAGKVQKAIEEQSQEAQRSFAKRYEETNAVLTRDIKGWNQETATKVRDFALGNGITQDQLAAIATTPTLAKLLHKAWLGDQLERKQSAAAKAAAAGKQAEMAEVQPLKTVGRKPSGAAKPGLHDDLPAEEWARRRNEQLRKRG